MLINATQKEELRVALVDGQTLYDLDIERTGRIQKKASIYKGRVTRVEPSLEAAFIDYGAERHGFLPLKEVAREYFSNPHLLESGKPHIRDALKPGQELIVQVDKEERGNKGAALTTFVGLAGSYLVLMPNNPRAGGISRRIEGDERNDLKDALNQLPLPDGMGLIVRTAGVGRSLEELRWDLDVLLSQWQAIMQASQRSAPFLIHRESDVIIRALRDYLRPDIAEILVDTEEAFQHAKKHIQIVRPDFADRVKRYNDAIPLFNRFQIENQIESAFKREVALDNGASIVIDPTEALIAIDINSARATEGSDIEETALQTNLVAAKEIARQLRLRDIGGLIVIDFIDMNSSRHQRMVENQLREELKADKARIQLGRISRFGLLEMSRQRLRPSLGDSSGSSCPRCEGQGTIRNVQSLALALMRIIQDEAMKENTRQVNVQVPVELAAYLVNEKRQAVMSLEQRHNIRILVLPNPHMVTPQYEVIRIREDDATDQGEVPSYKFISAVESKTEEFMAHAEEIKADEPAIKHFTPVAPAPVASHDKGFIRRIWAAMFGSATGTATTRAAQPVSTTRTSEHRSYAGKGHQHHRRGRGHHRGERMERQDRNDPRGERQDREHRGERHDRGEHRTERHDREHRHERHEQRDHRDHRGERHHDRGEQRQNREQHHERPEQREQQHERPEQREQQREQRGGRRHQQRNRRGGNRSRDDRYRENREFRDQDDKVASIPYEVESEKSLESTFEIKNSSELPIQETSAKPESLAIAPSVAEAAVEKEVSPFVDTQFKASSPLPVETAENHVLKQALSAEPQAVQPKPKAPVPMSFSKLTPEELKNTLVTLSETTADVEHGSHHYTQVTTKRELVESAPAQQNIAGLKITTALPQQETMVTLEEGAPLTATPTREQRLTQVVTKRETATQSKEKQTEISGMIEEEAPDSSH
ncbi:MAG: Rne/Rng family ribonuclease [Gammaproteobacteria bacterium]|nr:Rne/Rng family ribonuclease [Gammaproteobacteria bacterium]